jgi:hypothetical protein
MVVEDWAFEIERRRGDRSEQRRSLGSAWLCSDGRDELGTGSMVVKIDLGGCDGILNSSGDGGWARCCRGEERRQRRTTPWLAEQEHQRTEMRQEGESEDGAVMLGWNGL